MLAKSHSVAFVGADATLVDVEVHVASSGLPTFRLVGLAAASVREAEQRTRAAITSCDEMWPLRKITVNLAPGGVRKEGTHFDLPIALGVLAGAGIFDPEVLDGWLILGELRLDASVRPVRGVLAAAISASRAGLKGIICPAQNASEAAIVDGLEVVAVTHLKECLGFFGSTWTPPVVSGAPVCDERSGPDLRDVRGQRAAKYALEVAAAGGHNLLLQGPPGAGKTMLARCLPSLLPAMSFEESLDVTKIHSVAGILPEGSGLLTTRPFRTPHHNVSMAGLIGGGIGLAHPGEASLSHHGVLSLDELGLYRGEALDALRAPIEEGRIRIARSAGAVTLPCSFSLVAAMNPCPCGFRQDNKRTCSCSAVQMRAYSARVSGPLLDRFDMQISVQRLSKEELLGPESGESSEAVRERIEMARALQHDRYGSVRMTNARATRRDLEIELTSSTDVRRKLETAIDDHALSGRGVTRVLRVARTLADLRSAQRVCGDDVAMALFMRLDDIVCDAA
ncbi:MAG: magnesium chelatase family protein [Actinomycetota bacterium]|jgi:magnesium chelatase family protein|nr:magnesium chelatase family protein [Actinomycetota bacterium]